MSLSEIERFLADLQSNTALSAEAGSSGSTPIV